MRITRLAVAAIAGVAVVAVAVAVVALDGGSSPSATAEGGSTSPATAVIKRQDLVETDVAEGTLGYADPRPLVNRLPGTVTWLPPEGRVIRPDGVLYRIDDAPVVLMSGRVPAYRPLGPGVVAGADVEQLERTLLRTGYDAGGELTVDRAWDAATTAAVQRWQLAHDLVQTGTIEPGRVIFLPGRRRVATVTAMLGAPPRGPVLTTTSVRRRVTVSLDADKSELARRRARVTVALPSGEEVGGRITSVGTVATAVRGEEQAASSEPDLDATIEVEIRLAKATSALDQAPVTARFEKSRREDVLAVPVTALLARPGGAFAVQLVEDDGSRRVVAVEAGLYAGGYVQIAGPRLRPGLRVTNAAVR